MNRTTKGALATAVATVLLTGGAGTLAYWNDTETVAGTPISSGELKLGTPACGDGWKLDGNIVFTNQLIVPGDVLSKVCTIDLIATGEHLGADLGVTTAAFDATNDLTRELVPSASFTVGGATTNRITERDDTGVGGAPEITATITVTFDGPKATNASQALRATLNSVAVTATQTHDA